MKIAATIIFMALIVILNVGWSEAVDCDAPPLTEGRAMAEYRDMCRD